MITSYIFPRNCLRILVYYLAFDTVYPNTYFHIYTALCFFPYLSYCRPNISWASNYPSRLRRLEILQKRAIRITCSLRRLDSTKLAFKENNLLKLADITKFQIGLFMYRYHNKLLPSLFDDYFIQGVNVHKHYTRTSCNYRA